MTLAERWISPVVLSVGSSEERLVHSRGDVKPVLLSTVDEPATTGPSARDLAWKGDTETTPMWQIPENIASFWDRELFGWFLVFGATLLVGIMVQSAGSFLYDQFQHHVLLGIFFGLVVMGTGLTAAALFVAEIIRIKKIRKLDAFRVEANRLYQRGAYGGALSLTVQLQVFYQDRPEMKPAWTQFREAVNGHLNDREILTLFSRHFLKDLDQRGYDIIVKNATATALFSIVSSLAWLDALIFFWRNVRMVREIAECYGSRPGFTGSMLLFREVMHGMLVAGVADFATQEAAGIVGDTVTAAFLARTGQGVANGLMTARVGIQAMHRCRPTPFLPKEQPTLGRVRSNILEKMKATLGFKA